MSPRVYVLLDVPAGKAGCVVRTLRRQPGVLMTDEIESGLLVVVVLEAPSRQRLAKLTVQALSSVESVTDEIQLLLAKNECNTRLFAKCIDARTTRSRRSRAQQT